MPIRLSPELAPDGIVGPFHQKRWKEHQQDKARVETESGYTRHYHQGDTAKNEGDRRRQTEPVRKQLPYEDRKQQHDQELILRGWRYRALFHTNLSLRAS